MSLTTDEYHRLRYILLETSHIAAALHKTQLLCYSREEWETADGIEKVYDRISELLKAITQCFGPREKRQHTIYAGSEGMRHESVYRALKLIDAIQTDMDVTTNYEGWRWLYRASQYLEKQIQEMRNGNND